MGDRRTAEVAYLVVQAVAVVAWWVGLVVSPSLRDWFELDGGRRDVLNAFVLGDLVVLAVGSAAAAVALQRGERWAGAIVAAVAGGCLYSTLYLAAWVGLGGVGAVGLVPMVAATVATSAIAVDHARR